DLNSVPPAVVDEIGRMVGEKVLIPQFDRQLSGRFSKSFEIAYGKCSSTGDASQGSQEIGPHPLCLGSGSFVKNTHRVDLNAGLGCNRPDFSGVVPAVILSAIGNDQQSPSLIASVLHRR